MDRTQYYFDMYKTLLLLENSIERIIDNKHIRQSNIRLSKKLVDEFFEIITLIQTNKIERVPVILVGVDFWKPIDEFIKNTLTEKYKTVSPSDPSTYTVTDDENKIIEIIKS